MVTRTLLLVMLVPFVALAQSPSEPVAEATISAAQPEPPPPSAESMPKLKWSGDLRVRAQSEKNGDSEARLSPRLRARFGVSASIQKDLRAEIRIATAKGARSTNQTLGDGSEPGGRRRFVGLDLAYARWAPVEFGSLVAGRFQQLHYAPGGSEVILDDDLTLEGVGVAGEYEFASRFFVFGSAGSTYIRENYDTYYSQDLSDNMINFGQLGLRWKADRTQATIGTGFFNFTGVQGKNYADLAVGGKANGNSEIGAGVVAYPFLPRQYFAEVKFPVGSFDAKLFYEFIENREAPGDNHAQWIGGELGRGSWDVNLAYTEVEADSVMGLFTNSDFGDGVADTRGWIGKARWKFMRNMSARFIQMVGRTDMTGFNKEYRRTMLDLSASF